MSVKNYLLAAATVACAKRRVEPLPLALDQTVDHRRVENFAPVVRQGSHGLAITAWGRDYASVRGGEVYAGWLGEGWSAMDVADHCGALVILGHSGSEWALLLDSGGGNGPEPFVSLGAGGLERYVLAPGDEVFWLVDELESRVGRVSCGARDVLWSQLLPAPVTCLSAKADRPACRRREARRVSSAIVLPIHAPRIGFVRNGAIEFATPYGVTSQIVISRIAVGSEDQDAPVHEEPVQEEPVHQERYASWYWRYGDFVVDFDIEGGWVAGRHSAMVSCGSDWLQRSGSPPPVVHAARLGNQWVQQRGHTLAVVDTSGDSPCVATSWEVGQTGRSSVDGPWRACVGHLLFGEDRAIVVAGVDARMAISVLGLNGDPGSLSLVPPTPGPLEVFELVGGIRRVQEPNMAAPSCEEQGQ